MKALLLLVIQIGCYDVTKEITNQPIRVESILQPYSQISARQFLRRSSDYVMTTNVRQGPKWLKGQSSVRQKDETMFTVCRVLFMYSDDFFTMFIRSYSVDQP